MLQLIYVWTNTLLTTKVPLSNKVTVMPHHGIVQISVQLAGHVSPPPKHLRVVDRVWGEVLAMESSGSPFLRTFQVARLSGSRSTLENLRLIIIRRVEEILHHLDRAVRQIHAVFVHVGV